MTHELTMKQHVADEVKKKKSIALKAITIDEEEDSSSETEDEHNDDMALVIRKFRKFLGKKRYSFRRRYPTKEEASKDKDKEKEKELPICYECKKSGHFKVDCPILKKSSKKYKKKAMVAT